MTSPVTSAADEVRVAVIGVGAMGSYHLATLANRVHGSRVTVVSDFSSDRARDVAALAGGAKVVDDPIAAITDGDIDAVLLASPGFAHEQQLLACIERGLPVLCEKPLTADAPAAINVMRAEEKFGRPLVQVGFMRRFDPEHVQLRELVANGDLGRPLVLHYVHRNPGGPDGFTSQLMISESVVHEVDCARFLLGEEIASIRVVKGRPTAQAPHGVHDPMLVIMESASGCVVSDEIFVWSGAGYQVRAELVGEQGSAELGLDHHLLRRGTDRRWGGSISSGFVERFDAAYVAELQAWVDSVRAGRVVGPTAWDGYAATVVCDAGIRAFETDTVIPVELVDKPDLYR